MLKRVLGVPCDLGGEAHRGWLPPGAATPLPTPVRRVTLDLTIEGGLGEGYLLVIAVREEPRLSGDHWFADLAGAEATAEAWYGVGPDRWRDGP